MSKAIRLAPGHPAAGEIHRVRWHCQDDPRVAWTACGIRFAYGYVKPGHRPTARCGGCWS